MGTKLILGFYKLLHPRNELGYKITFDLFYFIIRWSYTECATLYILQVLAQGTILDGVRGLQSKYEPESIEFTSISPQG